MGRAGAVHAIERALDTVAGARSPAPNSHAYANARDYWRLAPAVLYAGRDPLPSLVQRAAQRR